MTVVPGGTCAAWAGKSEPLGILNWSGHPNGLAGPESPDRVTHYNFTECDFARQVRVRAAGRLKAQAGPGEKDVGPVQLNRPYTGIHLPYCIQVGPIRHLKLPWVRRGKTRGPAFCLNPRKYV